MQGKQSSPRHKFLDEFSLSISPTHYSNSMESVDWWSHSSKPGFELSISQSQNAIYFSIFAMSKKSYFTISGDTNLCAKQKKHRQIPFILLESCFEVNEWCLVDYFHREFRVSTQIIVRNYCIPKYKTFFACGRPFFFFYNSKYLC